MLRICCLITSSFTLSSLEQERDAHCVPTLSHTFGKRHFSTSSPFSPSHIVTLIETASRKSRTPHLITVAPTFEHRALPAWRTLTTYTLTSPSNRASAGSLNLVWAGNHQAAAIPSLLTKPRSCLRYGAELQRATKSRFTQQTLASSNWTDFSRM